MNGRLLSGQWWNCIVVVLLVTFFVIATEEAKGEERLHHFGTRVTSDPPWEHRFNPKYFSITEDAWRVDTLEQEQEPMPTGGVRSPFTVAGDFEIQINFSFDEISPPSSGSGAGIVLKVPFLDDAQSVAFSHIRIPDGKWIAKVSAKDDIPGGNHYHLTEVSGPLNRLVLRRQGGTFFFLAGSATDAEALLHSHVGPAEVPDFIQLQVTSGNALATIRGEVHSVSIVAEEIIFKTQAPDRQASVPPGVHPATKEGQLLENSDGAGLPPSEGMVPGLVAHGDRGAAGLAALLLAYPFTLVIAAVLVVSVTVYSCRSVWHAACWSRMGR